MQTKIKAFLLHLYPELAKVKAFQDLNLAIPLPHLTPSAVKTLRFTLPAFVVVFVILSSFFLGKTVMNLVGTKTASVEPVLLPTPAPTVVYKSQFTALKKSIENFNPAMPDPLFPIIDSKISLEKLPEN